MAPLVFLLLMTTIGVTPLECREKEEDASGGEAQKSVFSEIEFIRCLFEEGRLVVKHRGRMKVLHIGDHWPDAGLRVLSGDREGMVIVTTETEVLASGQAVPKAMAVLSRGPDGQVSIRTYDSESPPKTVVFGMPKSVSSS